MNTKYYSYLILSLIILLVGCRDDQTNLIDTDTDQPNPVITINATFNGVVFDEAGDYLENVAISLGDQVSYTDHEGYFQISGKADESGAFLKATLNGYYDAYGNVIPSDDGISHVRFKLIERKISGIINSTMNETLSLDNESSVSFQANSFKKADGSSYNGNVNVYMHYIDPTAGDLANVIPGDLSAVNLEDEPVLLQSFGMLNVELESDSGEKLQINQAATLKVKVPDSQMSNADDQIPLWYFDTETGLWKEEGVAVLNGSHYEGTVEHFTLWNCDVPFPYVVLTGTVTARTLVPNVTVIVTCVESGESAQTYTDDEGNFDGKVPANKVLLVEIIDECGNVIYSQEVGPLTEDEHLDILLDPSIFETITVSGTLVCDGENVSSGYVIISMGNSGNRHFVDCNSDGSFSAEIIHCDASTFDIVGIDNNQGESGGVMTFTVEDEVVVGELAACGQEIVYEVVFTFMDGTEYRIPDPIVEIGTIEDSIVSGILDYKVTSYDNFSSNNLFQAELHMVNWNGDIDDPLWGFAYEISIFGNPTYGYHAVSGSNDIEVNEFLEYVEITMTNIEIRDEVSGVEMTGDYFVRARIQ